MISSKRLKKEEADMKKILIVFLGVLCLSACGKRGKLEFPPGATYPRVYPAPRQPKSDQMTQIYPAIDRTEILQEEDEEWDDNVSNEEQEKSKIEKVSSEAAPEENNDQQSLKTDGQQ